MFARLFRHPSPGQRLVLTSSPCWCSRWCHRAGKAQWDGLGQDTGKSPSSVRGQEMAAAPEKERDRRDNCTSCLCYNLWSKSQERRQEPSLLSPAASTFRFLLQLAAWPRSTTFQLQVQVSPGVQVRVQLLKVVTRRLPARWIHERGDRGQCTKGLPAWVAEVREAPVGRVFEAFKCCRSPKCSSSDISSCLLQENASVSSSFFKKVKGWHSTWTFVLLG